MSINEKYKAQLRKNGVSLEAKATEEGRIEGYGATFSKTPDSYGDVVLPGAFSASLKQHAKSGTLPVMLWSHRLEQPIGRWMRMAEDDSGLYVEGKLNLATDAGREAFEHVKAGDASGLSIGFTIPEDGREYAGKGVFHLKTVELHEVSVVTVPANRDARISGVKQIASKADAIDLLRECGLSRKAAARFAAGGWDALNGDDAEEKAQAIMRQLDRSIELLRN
ncbi:MAG: HK97 family phage prohead protease [Paracoccaceae bacterium]